MARPPETKKQRLMKLATALESDRSSHESHWRELGEYYRPRRTRFQTSDRNKGDKRSQKLIDSTPVFCARTCAAGMMSGMTSPARPWFRLTVADKELAEVEGVKFWLEEVRERMTGAFLRSNWYDVLPAYYSDLAVFGTSAMIMEEDDETTIRCTHFPIGGYWLATNSRQQVRVFMRKFDLTVRQLVEQFGEWNGDTLSKANLSMETWTAWDRGDTEQPVTVVHYILENDQHDPTKLHAKFKPFLSCYYESAGPTDRVLQETGYDEWPVLATRWETVSGDVYGTDCPGMTALGDNKALQYGEKLGTQAIEKMVKPPMVAPAAMMNGPASILAGGINYVDEVTGKTFRPALDMTGFRIDLLGTEQDKVRRRIEQAFFVDLFLLNSQSDRRDITATEIMERKEEKLLVLGPVLERVNGDALDPAIDRLFAIMLRRGELPEPPEELQGVALQIQYVSVMAQAQAALGRSGVEAFVGFGKLLAEIDPSVLDKFDRDELVDVYAKMTGVPPKLVVSDERVAVVRQTRAKAAAAQQAAQQAEQMAASAQKLASADTSGKNALTDLLGSAGSNVLGAAPSPQGGM